MPRKTKIRKKGLHKGFIRGSLTLEAALVLPIFFTIVYAMLYFVQVLILQDTLHNYATKVCREVSSYGIISNYLMMEEGTYQVSMRKAEEAIKPESETSFATEIFTELELESIFGTLLDSLYLKEQMSEYLKGNPLMNKCIERGFSGISFFGSSVYDEDECVTIKMQYELKLPILKNFLPTFPVVQKVRIRSFNGHAVPSKLNHKEPTDKEMVYVTEHGSVYHTNPNCTHINIYIQSLSSDLIYSARNQNGAKYYKCEYCFKGSQELPQVVYVTKTGTCFHKSTACQSLTRNVTYVPLEEVSHLRECNRCSAYKEE